MLDFIQLTPDVLLQLRPAISLGKMKHSSTLYPIGRMSKGINHMFVYYSEKEMKETFGEDYRPDNIQYIDVSEVKRRQGTLPLFIHFD